MATIDAAGFSSCTSQAQARGTLDFLRGGLSSSVATPLALGSMVHNGNGLATASAVPLGHLVIPVAVVSAVATTSIRIRVTFDRPMLNDAALSDAANYDVQPQGPNGASTTVTSVEPQNVIQPTYVDLVVTEMTDGEGYEVTAASISGPVDVESTPIDSANDSALFTGAGVDPTILEVVALDENTVQIQFSEAMYDNVNIRNPNRYSFDNGLSVISVESIRRDIVVLKTSDQTTGILYTLTVSQP